MGHDDYTNNGDHLKSIFDSCLEQVDSSEMDAIFNQLTEYESYVVHLYVVHVIEEHDGDNKEALESLISNVTSLQNYCENAYSSKKCHFSATKMKLENFLSQMTFLMKR